MNKSKYLILGGGMVAGYAAKEFVEGGLKPGELVIISADTAPPYERPTLSKGFLAGRDQEEQIRVNPEESYLQHGTELKLGTEVAGINPERRLLTLVGCGEWQFEKLIIGTGARVRTLATNGRELDSIHYFFSDIFHLSYELRGDRTSADDLVERGEGHRLVAAFTMSRPDEERETAPRLIEADTALTASDVRSGIWHTG
jgi:NAD(P)H-nitrite reductase large subunit